MKIKLTNVEALLVLCKIQNELSKNLGNDIEIDFFVVKQPPMPVPIYPVPIYPVPIYPVPIYPPVPMYPTYPTVTYVSVDEIGDNLLLSK